jgi:hypothetical protein
MNIIEPNTNIWEEKNLTEPKKNCGLPVELDNLNSIPITEKDLIKNASNDITKTKKCSNCNIIKTINEFHKDANGVFGVKGRCNACHRIYRFNSKVISIAAELM